MCKIVVYLFDNEESKMKSICKFLFISAILLLVTGLAGCGETISGIGKDTKRIGQGVKTIFFKDR